MGATWCVKLFDSIEVSDWITIFSILINALLAYWIVNTIQNKMTNKRVLKDHFINEIKGIREEYKNYLNQLYVNQADPRKVIPWFKLINIKIDDLMTLINKKYKIDKKILDSYQNELRELITNNEDFNKQFKKDKLITFSEKSRNQFVMFQQTNNHLFNEIIIYINDAE